MHTVLQIEFLYPGPWDEELAGALEGLARDISDEPGLRWKIWTEYTGKEIAGGIYLFEDRADARAYLDKHRARLEKSGYSGIRARILNVNLPLSRVTRAPLYLSWRGFGFTGARIQGSSPPGEK